MKISEEVSPSILRYVKIYAPETNEDFIIDLIKLDIDSIEYSIDIDPNSLSEFLASMVETTFTLIDEKDFWACSDWTLCNWRDENYRNGYFTDIRNDFEQFSLTLRASIPQIREYAVHISESIVSKIQQIQDYCEKLKK